VTTKLKYTLRELFKVSVYITGIITFLYIVQYVKTINTFPGQYEEKASELLNGKQKDKPALVTFSQQRLTGSALTEQ
jgi:hypothetical protein